MKLPAPSHSQRMGKLAEIDYGSFGSSPWCIKCLDDKQQYIICEILFDEIVLSTNGASPCWSQILPSNKLTWGAELTMLRLMKMRERHGGDTSNIRFVWQSGWEWNHSEWAQHGFSSLHPVGHTFRADCHLNLFCHAPHALLTPYSLLLFPLFILWICFWAHFFSRQDQATLKDTSAQCSSFS